MSDKVYPYIGKSERGNIYTVYDNNTGYSYTDNSHHYELNARIFKNITREYLANTWGIVESAEHAEFIKELAVNAGFYIHHEVEHPNTYSVRENSIGLYSLAEKELNKANLEQITIPMPPKKDEPTEEWPQVGDEVLYNGVLCPVKLPADKDDYVVVDRNGGWCNPHIDEISKPKTPEQELEEDCLRKMQSILEEYESKGIDPRNILSKL